MFEIFVDIHARFPPSQRIVFGSCRSFVGTGAIDSTFIVNSPTHAHPNAIDKVTARPQGSIKSKNRENEIPAIQRVKVNPTLKVTD